MAGENGRSMVQLEIRNEEIVVFYKCLSHCIQKIGRWYELKDFRTNLSDHEKVSRIYTEVNHYQV